MSFIKKLTQDQQKELILSQTNVAKNFTCSNYYQPTQNIKLEDLFVTFILNKRDKSKIQTFIKDQLTLNGTIFKAKEFEFYELGTKGYGCSVIINGKKIISSNRFKNYKHVGILSVIDLAANELLDDLLSQISKIS